MKQLALPIEDSDILHEAEDALLHNFRASRWNYTIFQVDRATLLRVSDLLALRHNEILNNGGTIAKNAYIRDKKTGKPNTLCLEPVKQDPEDYFQWLNQQNLHSDWLFPSTKHPDRRITGKQFYKIMAKIGGLLGTNYFGTHTVRKTRTYQVRTRARYNIGLVMSLLNHSSETMTSRYLGLNQASREQMLDGVKFD